MSIYTAENTFVLAKRFHNLKRPYLLVNPLQAKHLPVSPSESLRMMECLGRKLAEKYPQARLVIGFAETATAIAAAAAGCLGEGCVYIHTTREEETGSASWVYFNEEHSHSVEQKLSGDHLREWMSASPQIIFIDDELSTGKTLINIVDQLRELFPEIVGKEIVAASIINRLSAANEERLAAAGIRSEYLVKLPEQDLSAAVARYEISAAVPAEEAVSPADYETFVLEPSLMNPRLGVEIARYGAHCREEADRVIGFLGGQRLEGSRVLVLGTEECMYPALVLGKMLEDRKLAASVACHATTRSPIGICKDAGYPIQTGYRLQSFYDPDRVTFIYNLGQYDAAVIVTDTPGDDRDAAGFLAGLLKARGCPLVIMAEGGRELRHV